MRRSRMVLHVVGVAVVTAALATAVTAQSISPSTFTHTITTGQTFTINKSITLPAAGATTVDLFFPADNTGSMGGIVNYAKNGASSILGALPSTYQFGVGSYLGDPSEGGWYGPTGYYTQQPLTSNKSAAQTGINSWFANYGGDTPEANFYALKQVADNAGWRATAQRLIVWFGDAPSHTETTTEAQAISALQAANAKVVAFNNYGPCNGIDGTYGGGCQATDIVNAVGGAVVNNFRYVSQQGFIDAVNAQISAITSTLDLLFMSSLAGPGLTLTFTCTDPLGCTGVTGGSTRTFDLAIRGDLPGTYDFTVFAQGVDAFETDHIVVQDATVTPEPTSMFLIGTGLAGLSALRRRRKKTLAS